MDLASFLEAVAPPKIRKTYPISSTPLTNPVSAGHHLESLKEWPDIRNKVQQLLDPLLGQKSNTLRTIANGFTHEAQRWSPRGNKSDVLRLGAHVYERPTVRVLYELFSVDSEFGRHQESMGIGNPDRVFYNYNYTGKSYEGSGTKFLIQWEPPWTFLTPQNLIHRFNNSRVDLDDKVVKAVHQLYGYMVFNNLTYGALCNYEALYLFRRTGDSGLEASLPFLYSDPAVFQSSPDNPRLYTAGSIWKALKILVIEGCGQTASDENMTQELWSQARKAIVAIHERGAIHGDIRIENFVIAKGIIKVIDLGMCCQGTPAEQAAELAELDAMRKSREAEHTSDPQ
ncbi:hypothetical protein TWF788_007360 [Orbilia oligospora]|uniref:Protein kinase domain-containing protein n=1 Tax=Orbilia oligospora TaxID=2813651 RepID=A0A7C8PT57_ORBOL|nr:hypothetical protein TWF788_007360 [Orbilia oligospora]